LLLFYFSLLSPPTFYFAKQCSVCAKGYVQPLAGQTFCALCPSSTYQPFTAGAQCLNCTDKDNMISSPGSTDISQCMCRVGTYTKVANDSSVVCPACSEGSVCDVLNQPYPLPARMGVW
jgi:hypothetical protein